jgi:endoglucanase
MNDQSPNTVILKRRGVMSGCMNRVVRCGVVVAWVMGMMAGFGVKAWGAEGKGVDAAEQNKRLGRGVNVIGYDPLWRDRSRARFKTEYFQMIRQAGFDHVRINLHPYRDGKPDEKHRISQTYLRSLDWAVEQALAAI